MLRVFVALGKQLPKNKAMVEATEEVAKLLAKYNCVMVQGGAKEGLMGAVVDEFHKYSDEVVMIVPEAHKKDLEGTTNKEHYIVEGESDRLRITIRTCDIMIVLPGGSGTLVELAYYNETKKSGEHNAKIVVLNTDGYYNKLFKFMKHQIKSGFMGQDGMQFDVIKNVKELEPILQQLITEKQADLQQEEVNAGKDELVEDMMEDADELKPIKVLPPKKDVKAKTVKKVAKAKETPIKSPKVKEESKAKSVEVKTTAKAKKVEKAPIKAKKEEKQPVKKTEKKKEKKTEKKAQVKKEAVKVDKKAEVEPVKKASVKTEKKVSVKKEEPKVTKKEAPKDAKKEVKKSTKTTVKKPAEKASTKAATAKTVKASPKAKTANAKTTSKKVAKK